MATWMIANGSDVHQGGDGPLMRAALNGDRIPMMELLVSHGADVNAEWGGDFPIIFAPCESMDPQALAWLLDHGARPDCGNARGRGTALDYVIGTYARSPERLSACIDLLLAAGGTTRYDAPGVLDVLRRAARSPGGAARRGSRLVHRRFPELDCGSTGGRRLLLQGATLLHVAAEFGRVDAARLLLDRGADVDARATVDEAGVGGQTALFHAVTQWGDGGLAMTQLLVERGADLGVRVTLPGHYERPDEFVPARRWATRDSSWTSRHTPARTRLRRSCGPTVPSSSYGEDRIASRRLVAAMMSRFRRRTMSATRSRPPAAASSTIAFSSKPRGLQRGQIAGARSRCSSICARRRSSRRRVAAGSLPWTASGLRSHDSRIRRSCSSSRMA